MRKDISEIENNQEYSKTLQKLCSVIMSELCNKNQITFKKDKFLIKNKNDNQNRLYFLKIPKLKNITYDLKHAYQLMHTKSNKIGKKILNQDHIECANKLASVKYRINNDLLEFLLIECDFKMFQHLT